MVFITLQDIQWNEYEMVWQVLLSQDIGTELASVFPFRCTSVYMFPYPSAEIFLSQHRAKGQRNEWPCSPAHKHLQAL